MKTGRLCVAVVWGLCCGSAQSEANQPRPANFTPVVLEGGFRPSTHFLSSANINKYEETNEVIEEQTDIIKTPKQMKYKHTVPEKESTTEYVFKLHEDVSESPANIDDNKVSKNETKVLKVKEPIVHVYSRPLLPLPRNFGFRLAEVLDLKQRVTDAQFPTISTFTENFEEDIDWNKGKSHRVKRSEESNIPLSLPKADNFKVGKWKIRSQSLDGKNLDAKEWIIPKDVPKEDVLNQSSYDMISDLVSQDIIDLGQELGKYKTENIQSFGEMMKDYDSENQTHQADNKNKSFEEILNSYSSSQTDTNPELPAELTEELRKPTPQSFHNFLRETNKSERQGRYNRPNILNAFDLENPGSPFESTTGRRFLAPGQRRHFYPLPGVQPAETGFHNHPDYRVSDDRQEYTETPWQQSGQASQLHYSVAERRILNTDGLVENRPSRFKSNVFLVNNGTGPQVIIVPSNEGLEDISLDDGQSVQSTLRQTDDKTRNLIDLLETISSGDDDVVRIKDESFFIKDEYFSDKNFLKNMLVELNSEAQMKKLNLLKESLTQKTALVEADRLSEANARLTDVGISLHKQGQVLDQVQQHSQRFIDEAPSNTRPDRSGATQSQGGDSQKTLNLLRRKKRLESILKKLSFLVENRSNLEPLQQTIKLQEERLGRSR